MSYVLSVIRAVSCLILKQDRSDPPTIRNVGTNKWIVYMRFNRLGNWMVRKLLVLTDFDVLPVGNGVIVKLKEIETSAFVATTDVGKLIGRMEYELTLT